MQNRLNFCKFIRIRHLFIMMIILRNLIFLPADSPAGEYPEADDLYVNDYAQLLTPEDAAGIRSMFTTLRRGAFPKSRNIFFWVLIYFLQDIQSNLWNEQYLESFTFKFRRANHEKGNLFRRRKSWHIGK